MGGHVENHSDDQELRDQIHERVRGSSLGISEGVFALPRLPWMVES